MNAIKSFMLISLLMVLIPAAYAADKGHEGMGSMGQSSGMMMQGGGMGMMDMDQSRDRIKSMQRLMDRMHQTTDSGQRRKLLREHMDQMQKFMGDMRGMMMGPGMKGSGSGMSMDDRQKWMEQRLDFMQQMMEQMIEQQSQMMK